MIIFNPECSPKELLLISLDNKSSQDIVTNLGSCKYKIEVNKNFIKDKKYDKYECIIININADNYDDVILNLDLISSSPVLLISESIEDYIIRELENYDIYAYFENPINFKNLVIAIETSVNIKKNLYINKLVNKLDEAIIYTDEYDNVQYMNEIAENLTGWSLQNAYNQPISEIFNVSKKKLKADTSINKDFLTIQDIINYNDDLFLYSKDGVITQIEKRITKIDNSKSKNNAIIFSDITDLAWQQKMLYKLFKIVEQCPIGIMITDEEGRIEFINNYFEKTSGYQLKEIIGHKPNIFKSDKYDRQFYKIIWDTLLSGKKWNGIICNKNKENKYYWNDTKLSSLRNENSEIINFISITSDITNHLRNKERINNIQNRYKLLLESVGEAIISYDNDEKIVFANRIAEKTLGYSISELINKKCFNLLKPKALENNQQINSTNIFKSVIDNFTTIMGDNFYFKNNEGEYFPVKYNITPYIENNQCSGAVLIFSDITELNKFKKNLIKLNNDLDIKNKELEKIINIVSLDLKIPLINIQGLNSLLLKDIINIQSQINNISDIEKINNIINDDILKEIKYIENNILSLNSLINNLIEYSRLETININFRKVNVNKIVKILCDSYNKTLKDESVDIICEKLPEAYGDENGINTIMHNLIDNAVKYRKRNQNTLIKLTGKIKDNQSIYCVEDNGEGISTEKQKIIFDIFHKVDSDNYQSIGVGLAICKKIIEKHNGRIWVESKVGVGSKFYIELQNKK